MNKPNKTQSTPNSVSAFLSTLTDARQRKDSEDLIKIMSAVSGKPPVLWGSSIVGFGSYHYKYASGREGDTPLISFSPRKGKLTLYLLCDSSQYPDLMDKLGKHETGKGCLYIKRLSDINLTALKELLTVAYSNPS